MRTMQYACAQRCAFVSCSTKSSNHSGRKIPSEQLRMKLNNSPNTKRSRGRCAFRVRLSSPASSDCPEAVSPSYAAMASATSVADQAEKKEEVNHEVGMKRASKYIADQMLESQHLKVLHQTLSTAWNRSGQAQSLPAVLALMGQYGVQLSPEEVEKIRVMDQDQQIAALVNQMPQDSQEQFQQFFLQLQLLVSTAMRVRDGLEDGAVEKVQMALDDADSTGVTQELLRMAIVQAGSEAALQMKEYEAWCLQTDEQMGRLIRGQEEAMAAKKKLATLQGGLQQDRQEHSERATKVCMNFVQNDTAFTTNACFQGWVMWAKRSREEAALSKDYEEKIERVRRKTQGYKKRSLASLRGLMEKKAVAREAELVSEVLKSWHHAVKEKKETDALAVQVDVVNKRLASIQGAQKETTKRVMDRMSSAAMVNLMSLTLEGWYEEVKDSQKRRGEHDLLAQTQARIHAYLKDKNEASLKVLKMALGGSETNIATQAFACWKSESENAKYQAELEAIMRENQERVKEYKERHHAAAASAMKRAARFHEEGLILEIFAHWRIESAMENTVARHEGRVDAKRQQLSSIRQKLEWEGDLSVSLRRQHRMKFHGTDPSSNFEHVRTDEQDRENRVRDRERDIEKEYSYRLREFERSEDKRIRNLKQDLRDLEPASEPTDREKRKFADRDLDFRESDVKEWKRRREDREKDRKREQEKDAADRLAEKEEAEEAKRKKKEEEERKIREQKEAEEKAQKEAEAAERKKQEEERKKQEEADRKEREEREAKERAEKEAREKEKKKEQQDAAAKLLQSVQDHQPDGRCGRPPSLGSSLLRNAKKIITCGDESNDGSMASGRDDMVIWGECSFGMLKKRDSWNGVFLTFWVQSK
ncbi:unnamed protein product [Durusdinium trenchii]|uniref:Uncharacterized protein n=1 Tax=Durusdinium trenchii TaxID=1381693 RepID=A0ABP0S384_9DINO